MVNQQQGDMVFLWDWENTIKAVRAQKYPQEEYDLLAGFRKLMAWLAGIAKAPKVFVFSPMHELSGVDATFHSLGFSIMLRPKITEITELCTVRYRDTTDNGIKEFGNFCINSNPGIKYLCLGSGDKHFVPLLKRAAARGIKIAAVVGEGMSLSSEVYKMIDNHPATGRTMLHYFSPTKSQTVNSG